jgi:hypothetical protein
MLLGFDFARHDNAIYHCLVFTKKILNKKSKSTWWQIILNFQKMYCEPMTMLNCNLDNPCPFINIHLTPKIPHGFWPNFVVSDIVGEIIFSKNQSMRIWRSNPRIFQLPCWASTSKNYRSSSHGIHEVIMFKYQSFFSFFLGIF